MKANVEHKIAKAMKVAAHAYAMRKDYRDAAICDCAEWRFIGAEGAGS